MAIGGTALNSFRSHLADRTFSTTLLGSELSSASLSLGLNFRATSVFTVFTLVFLLVN